MPRASPNWNTECTHLWTEKKKIYTVCIISWTLKTSNVYLGLNIIPPYKEQIPLRRFPGNCLYFTCRPLCGHLPTLTLNSDTLMHTTSIQAAWLASTFVWFPRCLLQVASQAGAGAVLGPGEVPLTDRETNTTQEGLNLTLTLKEQLLCNNY